MAPGKRVAPRKTPARSRAPASVASYLAALPADARDSLQRLRRAIKAAAPAGTEVIAYRIPMVKYQGRMLLGYAAFAEHCSLFPASYAVMRTFARELAKYDVKKATVRFPIGRSLPATLVRKIVKARIAEVDRKTTKTKRRRGP